ncbi:MAG: aminopeptidase [Lachnospiraceae bacterium]|nr:aminopeptidase [Lachnospiraceae bacterium]
MDEMRYFGETEGYAALLRDVWGMLDHIDDLDTPELACINAKLYEQILPVKYLSSYVNPRVAVTSFGPETGRLLGAVAAELRAAVPALYERNEDGLNIRIKLLSDVRASYDEKGGFDSEDIRSILYSYYYDNRLEASRRKLRSQLIPGCAPICPDLASESLNRRADDIIRMMYTCGEYVTDSEIAMVRKLCAMPDDRLVEMTETFTDGFIKGFEVTGRDLSIKDTVELRFNIGFLPMMIIASRIFKKNGLRCSMMRGGYSIFTGRSVDKNGFFGANPNPQFDLDHKNDLSLILDEELNAKRLDTLREAFEELKDAAKVMAGPACVDIFGEPEFTPETKPEAVDYDEQGRKLVTDYTARAGAIVNEYIPGDERSFTIIAYPMPSIGADFEEIFDATVRINTLDYVLYRDIQQRIIDVLDTAEYVQVRGRGENRTDLKVHLTDLTDPAHQTKFENCVADVNIPVGEVFTSPVLRGTEGLLHVTRVFLEGIEYHDLEIRVQDGMISGFSCKEGDKLIMDNILYHHETLPMGECAIGTNTTAYVLARKYEIESKLPILIAEKTGPHFAFGDTCYSHSEDLAVYNPDGKEIIARDNECSALRKTDPARAYFNCHTDITLPYDELDELSAVHPDGSTTPIISGGRFVLPGCEDLNLPFDE